MDKEAPEKIAIRLHNQDRMLIRIIDETSPINCSWDELAIHFKKQYLRDAKLFLSDIGTLGYRKLKGEPPLLSYEEIGEAIRTMKPTDTLTKVIAQTQRDSDIEWYKGE